MEGPLKNLTSGPCKLGRRRSVARLSPTARNQVLTDMSRRKRETGLLWGLATVWVSRGRAVETASLESSGAPEIAAPGAIFPRNFPRTLELALDMTQPKKVYTSLACPSLFLLYPQRVKHS